MGSATALAVKTVDPCSLLFLEHPRALVSRPSSRATFALFEPQEGPKSADKSVHLVYEPHRMLRFLRESGGLPITGLQWLYHEVDGSRRGRMLAHFLEVGGKLVIKQEFRITRFKYERPKRPSCLLRGNSVVHHFGEVCAHRIKYRIASLVEVVLQLCSRNDHLLYRNPRADNSNYGNGKCLHCLNPTWQHCLSVSLTTINHGTLRNEQPAGCMKLGNARCVRPVIAARRQTSVLRLHEGNTWLEAPPFPRRALLYHANPQDDGGDHIIAAWQIEGRSGS